MLLKVSYYLSIFLKRTFHFGKPFSIAIEPTNCCNLSCPECPSGNKKMTRNRGYMDFKLYQKILDEFGARLANLTLYFQGEPFLHQNLIEMIRYAKAKHIYTTISTNGHFLDADSAAKIVQSGLDRIIISVDGATQDIYSLYRVGGQLNKVLAGIENLSKAKKQLASPTPKIIVQFLVFGTNEHQIKKMKKLKSKLGADKLLLKSAQVYQFENGSSLIPSTEKYSRYKQLSDGKYIIKNDLKNRCWRLWSSAVITWDGNVLPCCFDKDAGFIMGNVKNNSFRSIWNSDNYKEFRNRILTNRKDTEMCKNCTDGLKIDD